MSVVIKNYCFSVNTWTKADDTKVFDVIFSTDLYIEQVLQGHGPTTAAALHDAMTKFEYWIAQQITATVIPTEPNETKEEGLKNVYYP